MPKYKRGKLIKHTCPACGYSWESPNPKPKKCPMCFAIMPYWKNIKKKFFEIVKQGKVIRLKAGEEYKLTDDIILKVDEKGRLIIEQH